MVMTTGLAATVLSPFLWRPVALIIIIILEDWIRSSTGSLPAARIGYLALLMPPAPFTPF